ncbi:MAG: hypothetical protein CVU54_04875 [Deltaproteobacteria bacterium HGW-Deltaproteobacteria-12]|jgi:hypothetical protein|nr:MAG: hypothetical protein CVU54_04875 [Deltaproteobacteria bacterium HGW-Deltaproteobacteria-12]
MTVLTRIKYVAIIAVSLFFLIVGINTLIGCFRLKNPVEFVMYLFSSSLLILVSISGLIFVFFRIFPPKQKSEINNDKNS